MASDSQMWAEKRSRAIQYFCELQVDNNHCRVPEPETVGQGDARGDVSPSRHITLPKFFCNCAVLVPMPMASKKQGLLQPGRKFSTSEPVAAGPTVSVHMGRQISTPSPRVRLAMNSCRLVSSLARVLRVFSTAVCHLYNPHERNSRQAFLVSLKKVLGSRSSIPKKIS